MFSSVNTCWTLVGAFLVYFMQAGFALCEAGFTRAKNTGNIPVSYTHLRFVPLAATMDVQKVRKTLYTLPAPM